MPLISSRGTPALLKNRSDHSYTVSVICAHDENQLVLTACNSRTLTLARSSRLARPAQYKPTPPEIASASCNRRIRGVSRLFMFLWLVVPFFALSPRSVIATKATETAKDANLHCVDSEASVVTFDHPRVTFGAMGKSVFAFAPVPETLRIAVTPSNSTMDPDAKLYARSNNSCKMVAAVQESGSDLLLLEHSVAVQNNVSIFYLEVTCSPSIAVCQYHVALTKHLDGDGAEELPLGEEASGVVSMGVPYRFYVDCDDKCEKVANQNTNQRITFSVWPRDATSVHHLRLLVRFGEEPSTKDGQHIAATKGWFSGEVVSTAATKGRYFVTVVKNQGNNPLPFKLTARLPESLEQLPLGKPVFGAVSKNQMAFYKFYVSAPDTDIAIYLTNIDGDPDMSLSHSLVNNHPTPLDAQWHSRSAGDDELIVSPSDPKRNSNSLYKTGWYHLGVHGYKAAAYSLIALVEKHSKPEQSNSVGTGEIIDWTELWLGLPQAMSAWPGKYARFLFFTQLDTRNLFVRIEVLEGLQPDLCMVTCGVDPHKCPFISPHAANASKAPSYTVSSCAGANLKSGGISASMEATVAKPCKKCWYAILVTSIGGKSRFRITLGAEGRAHPLVVGMPFRGHVDVGHPSLLLVYDLPPGIAKRRAQANSTLRAMITPAYGDPLYAVTNGVPGEGGVAIFNSSTGSENFELKLLPGNASAGSYYFQVWAGSKHARFRLQLSWDTNMTLYDEAADSDYYDGAHTTKEKPKNQNTSAAELGLAWILDAEAVRGQTKPGKADIYVFMASNTTGSPDVEATCTPIGGSNDCRIFALTLQSQTQVVSKLSGLKANPETAAIWKSEPGEDTLTIRNTDAKYLRPSVEAIYAFGILPALKGAAGLVTSASLNYQLTVRAGNSVQELPANGVAVANALKTGQYHRYRILIGEAGRAIAIRLQMVSGDADLYLGINASVSRRSWERRSESMGSDQIFVSAIGKLNQMVCSSQILQTAGQCSYFIAVFCVSERCEYRLTASIPKGIPVELTTGQVQPLAMHAGSWQYFAVPIEFPMQPKTLQVSKESGDVVGVFIKLTTKGYALHPGAELAELSPQDVDIAAMKFAGVWRAPLDESRLAPLCKKNVAASDICSAFVAIKSDVGFIGSISLLVDPVSGDVLQRPRNDTQQALTAVELKAGQPARAEIPPGSVNAQVTFTFRVPVGAKENLMVSVQPLSACKPSLEVAVPGKSERFVFHYEERLHYIAGNIEHGQYQPGIATVYVGQQVGATTPCQVDVRASFAPSEGLHESEIGVLPENFAEALVADTPLTATTYGDRPRYFIYTSQIMSADRAADRDHIEVVVMPLAGHVEVSVAFLRSDSSNKVIDKKKRLDDALNSMVQCKSGGSASHETATLSLVCPALHQNCGGSLACQVIIRVYSARPGRPADFLLMAASAGTDASGKRSRAETLLPGMQIKGRVEPYQVNAPTSGPALYQIYFSNPAAKLIVRLSCQGADKQAACDKVLLTADARVPPPEQFKDRAYTSQPASNGELEIVVNSASKAGSTSADGQCRVPCVLSIRVEVRPGKTGFVDFSLLAVQEASYSLLLDGDDALSFTARPSHTEYFLFDSRRASPLLTLILRVPYDPTDTHLELVSMYIVDCATSSGNSESGASEFGDLSQRPSAENYKYRGTPNTRGQIVAFVTNNEGNSRASSVGDSHCYYRIAVVSHRPAPVTLSIRGFESQEVAPLVIGEPLHGLVAGDRRFTYQVDAGTKATDVVLNLEVCSGNVNLRTAARGPQDAPDMPGSFHTYGGLASAHPTSSFQNGVPPVQVPLTSNQFVEVSSQDGTASTYILSAEAPETRVWLEPRPTATITLTESEKDEGSVVLDWSPALLLGAGQPSGGSGGDSAPAAEYEVFYEKSDGANGHGNVSAACGLYYEWQQRSPTSISRIATKTSRQLSVTGLEPNQLYIFNVVARSVQTGLSVAYVPYHHFAFRKFDPELAKGFAPSSSATFWDDFVPVFLVVLALGFIAYVKPCCKGGSDQWRRYDVEMPSRVRSYQPMERNYGSYAPPSIVGISRG